MFSLFEDPEPTSNEQDNDLNNVSPDLSSPKDPFAELSFGTPENPLATSIRLAMEQSGTAMQEVVDALKQIPEIESCYQASNGRLPYSLEEHHRSVVAMYETYMKNVPLPPEVSQGLMVLTLALHDIGKGIAHATGRSQHVCHQELIEHIRPTLPVSDDELGILLSLVKGDALGRFLSDKTSLEQAVLELEWQWQDSGISKESFFQAATLYHRCDVGGYTRMTGGPGSLEHLFVMEPYTNTREFLKLPNDQLTAFNPAYVQKLNILREAFIEGI